MISSVDNAAVSFIEKASSSPAAAWSDPITTRLQQGAATTSARVEALVGHSRGIESREIGPESLEATNFRVDSSWWDERAIGGNVRVKTNPEGDITEIADGPYAGQQLFTWEAAMRETAKAGKRMPTKEEWLEIIQAVNPFIDAYGGWQDDKSVREALALPLVGCRSGDESLNRGYHWNYWSASSIRGDGYYVHFSPTRIRPSSNREPERTRSVRCFSQ